MRFGTAIERLVDNYRIAKGKVWIRDEVAWALYQTWKEADDRKTSNSSEKTNNCEDEPTEWDARNCMSCEYNPWVSKECNECYGKHYEPKDEPQRGCDADCNEDCNECAKETELWRAEQTEREGE